VIRRTTPNLLGIRSSSVAMQAPPRPDPDSLPRTSVTLTLPAPSHTAWMWHPCRTSDMNYAAPMLYVQRPAGRKLGRGCRRRGGSGGGAAVVKPWGSRERGGLGRGFLGTGGVAAGNW